MWTFCEHVCCFCCDCYCYYCHNSLMPLTEPPRTFMVTSALPSSGGRILGLWPSLLICHRYMAWLHRALVFSRHHQWLVTTLLIHIACAHTAYVPTFGVGTWLGSREPLGIALHQYYTLNQCFGDPKAMVCSVFSGLGQVLSVALSIGM